MIISRIALGITNHFFLGLGMFLHSIGKSKSWSDHLQHVLIFCRVHIQRKLHQKFRDTPEYTLMDQILAENNKSKFDIILGQLLNSSNLEVRNWAKIKMLIGALLGCPGVILRCRPSSLTHSKKIQIWLSQHTIPPI